jgi:DNA-binding HxlR family transcriptional regulator
MKFSSPEKIINILLYLKKSDGNWKNTREIQTNSTKVTQNRKRIEDDLQQLVTRELINVRPAENPQAKFEYKILPKGKDKLSAFLQFMNDPDIKHIAGIKENTQFDEV